MTNTQNLGAPLIEVGEGEEVIDRFAGQYAFLSNFHLTTVRYAGWKYPSVEHAFQAAKTLDLDARARICGVEWPRDARRLGRAVELRPDWEEVKGEVMRALVGRKFADDLNAVHLLGPGDAYLIEGNTWGDQIWGAVREPHVKGCPWRGWNLLGRILMDVRRQLRVEWAATGGLTSPVSVIQ